MERLGEWCGRSFASPWLSYSITMCGQPERDRRKGYDLHQGDLACALTLGQMDHGFSYGARSAVWFAR